MKISKSLSANFVWTGPSKTSMCLAGYHRPDSITWRWALYWTRWSGKLSWPIRWFMNSGHGIVSVSLPIIGSLSIHWQPNMIRSRK